MKSLLIGEVSNGSLSAGTLEIISKLQENSLEFNLVVIGSEEGPSIGSDSFDVTYIKVNPDALSLSGVADKISEKINSDGIELVLASSTYVGRDSKFSSNLKIKFDILVFIILSFIVVPIPFCLEWAPRETTPNVPKTGAQDWKTKSEQIIIINFFTTKFVSFKITSLI